MQTVFNLIVFILCLGSIIFIHELGHFMAAKFFGVYCSEFSMGMGPSLWHFKKGETTYHLRLLPIGGYVSMAGEADQEMEGELKDVPFERTLKGIKTYKQVIVMAAGVIMNFIMAFILMFSLGLFSGLVSVDSNIFTDYVEGGVALEIGMQPGDELTKITYIDTNTSYDITNMTTLSEALSLETTGLTSRQANVEITYIHDGKTMVKTATLGLNEAKTSYQLGVYNPTRKMGIVESFQYTCNTIKDMSFMIVDTLKQLITDSKNTISQLAGPVGIYQATAQMTEAKQYSTLIFLVASLSVNIGIFNLLPIPGLDGSQILFALVERIMGREIPTKIRYVIQVAGLVLVFGLMFIVMIQDIIRMM